MRTTFSIGDETRKMDPQNLRSQAKEVARKMMREPTLLESLERWWSRKYRLPSNHELFQTRTIFDLLVEWELDYFENNPLEIHRGDDGEVYFRDTGDDLIDHWEAMIFDGAGADVDLKEAFLPGEFEKVVAKLERAKGQKIARSYSQAGYDMRSTVQRVQREAQRQEAERQSYFRDEY